MKKTLSAIILAMSITGCRSNWLTENFHQLPPTAYRSAQLDKDELEEIIQQYCIKTVINLRGEQQDEEWYQEEQKICRQYGIEHINVRLSARRMPTRNELKQLITTIDNAQPPIYFHCAYGSDRTGLASTVYRILNGASLENALMELDFYPYGHLPGQIDDFFEMYEQHTKITGRQDFRNWALNVYLPD